MILLPHRRENDATKEARDHEIRRSVSSAAGPDHQPQARTGAVGREGRLGFYRRRDRPALQRQGPARDTVPLTPNILSVDPQVYLYEDVLQEPLRAAVADFLKSTSWHFGATSDKTERSYPYWYKHFAGVFDQKDLGTKITDCLDQLRCEAPIIAAVWDYLNERIFRDHILVRCYANSYPYGSEGVVHRDANDTRHHTAIFYPNSTWDMNWAGETMFFRLQQPPEILTTVWPRPNRLVIFRGIIPHVARGISRSCPLLRTTLMFKTKKL
jgi:SM-20-related protein